MTLDLAVQTSLALSERDFMKLKPHPIADLFPMMKPDEHASLVESIRRSGLRIPIVVLDGQILDGRNRYRACQEAGVAPTFVELKAGEDPYRYVWDHNAERRDLDQGQRAAILVRFEKVERTARARQHEEEANRKRSKAANTRRGDGGRLVASPVSRDTEQADYARERDHVADKAKVSPATAARVLAVAGKDEAMLDDVADGKIKLAEAGRQLKRREIEQKVAPLPADKYRVIYADPPWQYSDSRVDIEGYSASAAEDHYPTMSVAQLCALDVAKLADDNAVLFCWATFPLLPDALEVVRAWGFKYKTAFVWSKGRPNFGHYHNASAEMLLVCTRGSGVPDCDKREAQVQTVERTGKHSAKPEEFRALIERLYTRGKRIELFRRGVAPKGWDVWGNEAVNHAA